MNLILKYYTQIQSTLPFSLQLLKGAAIFADCSRKCENKCIALEKHREA